VCLTGCADVVTKLWQTAASQVVARQRALESGTRLPTIQRCLGVLALLGALAIAAAGVAHAASKPQPLIVFMTDFGTRDDAVAICKGVIKSIAPETEIIDLTHEVTPFSIAEGARLLVRTAQYYPPGTVFLTVIDPGVGTSRRSIVVKTKRGQYFVLPDNGLVTQVADRDGIAGIREISNPHWLLTASSSSTFHGRDIYAPVAAHLARGEDWTQLGPERAALTRLEVARAVIDASGIKGLVVALDGPFGNLVTNVEGEDFRKLGYRWGDPVRVALGTVQFEVPFTATFGAVAPGQPLLFIDSRGQVSLAINQGNFAKEHNITPPAPLTIYAR
jgi:S-adenosyl-L-methionine hydrolase (adenosine-forming)